MGVVDDPQRRRAGERAEQLGDRVARVAQADHGADGEQAGERRAQRVGADEGGLVPAPGRDDVVAVACEGETEVAKDLRARDARGVVRRPVHQDRHLVLREQHRQQCREIGDLARAVVRRQHDRRALEPDVDAALAHGVEEAVELGDGLALDPHRDREGADLEVGDLAVEHLDIRS